MSEEKFTDQLKKYYQYFFPCEMLFEWLNYDKFGIKTFDGNFKFSKCREICFTHKSDKFERYRSFGSPLDMKLSIVQKNPLKIDVGPIYNFDPEMKQSYHSNIQPVERELVFDIDLNDYNDVRYCCVDSNVCNLCWPLITCAIRILDHGLRNDFGFKNILWVYSGRRGIHCWVCDYRARILSDEQRSAITEYFKIFEASDENFSYLQGMNSSNKHHSFIEKSIELTIKYFFQHLLPKQKFLETKIKFEKILDMLPVEGHAYKRKLIKLLEGINGSVVKDVSTLRWECVEHFFTSSCVKSTEKWIWRYFCSKVILIHTYPRLDVGVSIHMNHLLKAPFCIHPETRKVCVPINLELADDFNPNQVPKLESLIQEFNGVQKLHRASYNQYVDIFRKFKEKLLNPEQTL